MKRESLLMTVGAHVRAIRDGQGMSRRVLSVRSGVSERFLAQLEAGKGNISLARFADVAEALGVAPAELLAGAPRRSPAAGQVIALLGVRGAGKSTVGERLARRLGVDFVEVDREVEDAAGLTLGEIFMLHGETYYHRVQQEVLTRLFDREERMVIAVGGSIVNSGESYELLKSNAHTVWLRAGPEDHWNRVIKQGDSRPMAKNPHAFAELKDLLATREPLYATADRIVDTSDRSIDDVLTDLSAELQ